MLAIAIIAMITIIIFNSLWPQTQTRCHGRPAIILIEQHINMNNDALPSYVQASLSETMNYACYYLYLQNILIQIISW